MLPNHIERIIQVYMSATSTYTGKFFTTINELTDQIPALRPETLLSATTSLISLGPIEGNKLLCEEDKGAALGALTCVMASLPLAMARWYPYDLPGGVEVPISMEYFSGTLYVNGISEDDRLIIIDDTLSSGGTILALANAIKMIGAEIIDIRVVVEKIKNGGRERIKETLGIDVKSVIGIDTDNEGHISVVQVMGKPYQP